MFKISRSRSITARFMMFVAEGSYARYITYSSFNVLKHVRPVLQHLHRPFHLSPYLQKKETAQVRSDMHVLNHRRKGQLTTPTGTTHQGTAVTHRDRVVSSDLYFICSHIIYPSQKKETTHQVRTYVVNELEQRIALATLTAAGCELSSPAFFSDCVWMCIYISTSSPRPATFFTDSTASPPP